MTNVDDVIAAIIGTREPDISQSDCAERLALVLSRDYGVTISTGGACGIDHCAMKGAVPGRLNVYLPWSSYNREIIPAHANRIVADRVKHANWFASVEEFHPNPGALSQGAMALHARNFGIIYPAKVVLAFPDHRGGGGTGQGVRIALGQVIPVMQFNRGSHMPSFCQILQDVLVTLELDFLE